MSKLAIACELSLNNWLETFPDVIPEAECSKKHEKWKRNLFNKMRDDHYHIFTTRTIKVILVAAILCALLLTAFVIPSSREFILNQFDKHSTYKLTENNKNSVTGEITVGYIPDGYELENNYYVDKQIISRYENLNGEFFTVCKFSSAMKVDFDTENFVLEELLFDKVKYVYCQGNEGLNNIVWCTNDYVYQIEAPYDKEILLKIAKTVK